MNDIKEKYLDQQIHLIQQARLELSPRRDLWPGIQASIQSDETKYAGLRFYPLAAAAVLVLFGALSLNHLDEQEITLPVTGHLVVQHPIEPQDSGLLINAGYEQVRTMVVDELLNRLETLSPEEKVVIETNMTKIDAALAEINTALKSNPDNLLLQKLLISAYSDDLALFGEINSMTRTLDDRIQL